MGVLDCDWPLRRRRECVLHVNTNTKSLKGFHPGKSLIFSPAFITATERSRLEGGESNEYQTAAFASAYHVINSQFFNYSP